MLALPVVLSQASLPYAYNWNKFPAAWFGANATDWENATQIDAIGQYSLAIFGWQTLITATGDSSPATHHTTPYTTQLHSTPPPYPCAHTPHHLQTTHPSPTTAQLQPNPSPTLVQPKPNASPTLPHPTPPNPTQPHSTLHNPIQPN